MWLQTLTLPQVVAKFSNKIEDIHLVETSPAMRNLQKEKLHLVAKAGCQLHWHDSINDITPSNHFSLVVAHEFFDALPVHVLQVCCVYTMLLSPAFRPMNSRKHRTAGTKCWLRLILNLLRAIVQVPKRVFSRIVHRYTRVFVAFSPQLQPLHQQFWDSPPLVSKISPLAQRLKYLLHHLKLHDKSGSFCRARKIRIKNKIRNPL